MAFMAWLKQELIHNSIIALKRFPVTLFFAFLTSLLCISAIEMRNSETQIYRYILIAALGVPLSFTVSLYSERHELPGNLSGIAHVGVVIFLLGYFWLFLPEKMNFAAAIRYALVAAMVHVWVSFAAHPRQSSVNAFWQFNRSLFLRFAVSSLFSGVLYIGLAIALISIDTLLGIRVNQSRYPELFVVCAGIIHPWFFLAGTPLNLDSEVETYPAVLRVFAQYVLIPLVALYVVILYLYSAKVIVNWEWPRYKATYLVGLFSAPGILATLLLYPLSVSTWVKKYTRSFYILLIPLVAMMLICVYRRVSEHGLTEMMVVAIAMGIWLIFISCFMLKTHGENIRLVPVTLVAVLLVVALGPVSAPNLGQTSQTARLEKILLRLRIPDGKITLADPGKFKVNVTDYEEILNKSRYLTDHFGAAALAPFIRGEFSVKDGYQAHTDFIAHFLNTEPHKTAQPAYRSFIAKTGIIPVSGYAGLIRHNAYRRTEPQTFSGDDYRISINWQENRLLIEQKGRNSAVDFGNLYRDLVKSFPISENSIPRAKLSRAFKLGGKKGMVYFSRIAGDTEARDIEFLILTP